MHTLIYQPQHMDRMEWAAQFPENFFDVIIDDFPYGINAARMRFTQTTDKPVKQKNGRITRLKTEAYTQSDWDAAAPPQSYFDEMRRISRHQVMFGVDFVDWHGLPPGRVEWDKMVPPGVSFSQYEVALQTFTEHVEPITCLWSGMLQAASVARPDVPRGNKRYNDPRIHPTQKPILLWLLIFKKFGIAPGSKIGCPHFGSGSSLLACYEAGMHCWGCEISEEYFQKSAKWQARHKNRHPLFNF